MEVWPPLKIDWSNKDAAVSRIREQTSIAEELDELDPDVEEQYIKAPVRDGYENSLRIFKPKGTSKPGPLIVLYHGTLQFSNAQEIDTNTLLKAAAAFLAHRQ